MYEKFVVENISSSGIKEKIEVDISMQYTDTYDEKIVSFVNNVKTIDGGSHEVGFKTALTRVFNDYAKTNGFVKGNAVGAYMLGGICFIMLGFTSGLLSGCLNVTFVKAVDHDYLARIGAVFNAIAVASAPVATFIVGILAVSLSVAKIVFGFGIFGTLMFIGLFFFRNQKSQVGVVENET